MKGKKERKKKEVCIWRVWQALRTYPAQLTDSEHNVYRVFLVEIIARLPHNEILRDFARNMGDICLFVIESDLEDNATKCIRVFYELVKNFRTQLKDIAPRLLDFLCKLYERFDETVKTRFSSMLAPQRDSIAVGHSLLKPANSTSGEGGNDARVLLDVNRLEW